MKILLIHCHYRLPGGEDAVFAAERALLEQHGHTVVVYERSNEEAAHGAAKALLPFRAVWNRRAARDVRNIMEQQHIDAVHIHNTLLLLSPAVVRAAKKCGVPVVLTLHNFRLFCPNGILLRDGRVCEDCPHHGLHCALRHRCYRGSRAQTLVVVAAYWLHRVLGTWRGSRPSGGAARPAEAGRRIAPWADSALWPSRPAGRPRPQAAAVRPCPECAMPQ